MTGTGTLTKNGSGRLNLTGTSSVGGGTTLNAGGLTRERQPDQQRHRQRRHVLSGVGNINGNVTRQRRRDRAGQLDRQSSRSIGNLNVNRGIYEVEINDQAAATASRLGPGSQATLNGGTIEVSPRPAPTRPISTYTILAASARRAPAAFSGLTERLRAS